VSVVSDGLVPLAELHGLSAPAFGAALAPLFEAAGPLGARLFDERPFGSYESLLARAAALAFALPEPEQVQLVNAHPRIGAAQTQLSALSLAEQGGEDPLDGVLAELNAAYEAQFGFRFVVFVNRRPKSVLVDVLRDRLQQSRSRELDTAVHELFAIARDRLVRLSG
jgi:2-oxo-4-hydroxy-4-carboxy--5-ureidoimidazoline (OHCU) decarboxylase